eukprot:CAMPEP_0168308338 /NCGR_PEP_ID=MMETSP0142_2-20121227/61764_1 /TAXON_ID=44445 /ORGANISM="Pseudo-nitzschia australis, Strain 10249 10 AB" /LENGTH=73 /DNA_ID=CAMNT_0008260727 /DNA_START=34 /DNA_END=255 /DNA_ORIENTATION=-
MGENFHAAAINYKRTFDPSKMEKTSWKILVEDYGYRTAKVPNFTGESTEELIFCEELFRSTMKKLAVQLLIYE